MIYIDEETYIDKCEAAYALATSEDPLTDLEDEEPADEDENNETESDHECPYCQYQCDWCVG